MPSVFFSVLTSNSTTNQPQYLHLISVQPCHNIRSSSMVTLARPPTRSSMKITNRSFQYAAPCLWNELPTDLREPRQTQPPSLSPITYGSSSSSSSSLSPLATSQSFILISRLGSSANPFLHRPRWSSYVAPKPTQRGSKTQNRRFTCKIALRLKKVCYKVSLCENCQRQSCKAFIGLTIRA